VTFPRAGIGGSYPPLLSAAVNLLDENLNITKKNIEDLLGASKEVDLLEVNAKKTK
jgi:hypothetical protein